MSERCIQVKDGKIVNVILADPAAFDPGDGSALIASDQGNPGDGYADGVITPAPAVLAVPASIALWKTKTVLSQTAFSPSQAAPQYQAALAGCSNLLEAANALIASLNNPGLSQFWASASDIQATDSTLAMIAAALGVSATLDDLLIQAASVSF